MLRFEALVFDFDGVLVESVDLKTRAFAELYAGYGQRIVDEVVAYHLAHGGVSRFEKFRHFHRALLGLSLAADEEAALGRRFSALVEQAVAQARWVGGAQEFLERYHRRLPLFVASGTPQDELRRIIAQRGAAHYFAAVRGAPSSKSEIITAVLRERNLPGERVLMVGDAVTDYEGARAAGVRFLGIAAAAAERFPGALAVLPDLTRLEEFLLDRASG